MVFFYKIIDFGSKSRQRRDKEVPPCMLTKKISHNSLSISNNLYFFAIQKLTLHVPWRRPKMKVGGGGEHNNVFSFSLLSIIHLSIHPLYQFEQTNTLLVTFKFREIHYINSLMLTLRCIICLMSSTIYYLSILLVNYISLCIDYIVSSFTFLFNTSSLSLRTL